MNLSHLIPQFHLEDWTNIDEFSEKRPGIHPIVISFSVILRYVPDVTSRLLKVEQWDEMEQNRKRYRISFHPTFV